MSNSDNDSGKRGKRAGKQLRNKSKLCPEMIAAQWKPGQSGNPKGRAHKPSLAAAIIRRLNQAEELYSEGVNRVDANGKRLRSPTIDELADGFLVMALEGNVVALGALNTLLDRLDGKVAQKTELTGKDGNAIEVRQQKEDVLSRLSKAIAIEEASGDTESPN